MSLGKFSGLSFLGEESIGAICSKINSGYYILKAHILFQLSDKFLADGTANNIPKIDMQLYNFYPIKSINSSQIGCYIKAK